MRLGALLAAVMGVAAATWPAAAAATAAADSATREAAAQEEAGAAAEDEAAAVAPDAAPFADPAFGPRYTIERIEVRGNRKTAASLILGEIELASGDEVAASDPRVEASRIRLLALGFFLNAHLALERGARRGSAVLVVEVEERGTVIVNALHLGASRATAFWGGLDVAENNVLGRGIGLGGGFVASTRPDVTGAEPGLGARLRVSVPALGGTGVSMSASGIYAAGSEFYRAAGPESASAPADFVALHMQRAGVVLGAGRAVTRATRLYLDLRQEGISADLPENQLRDLGGGVTVPIDFGIRSGFSRVGSLAATLDIDTRSDPLLPRTGTHLALSMEAASGILGSSYTFLKLVLQGSVHRRAWRGHVVGLYGFAGAIFGDAVYFDRFFVGDLDLFLPPRALGLNFSTQPARNLLGTSIAGHRYDDFAARVLVEYAVPLWRRRRLFYNGDAFVAVGVYGMASPGAFRDPARTGLGAWPVDVTADLGVRLDTYIGVFTLSLGNALGRIPF